ncbi:MAG TPA: carboxypeptidase regulatory-like domain-containing protein [Anaeromyxobacteraceae bacterium]|nr:carboxypeptidase regulatory-like domain-containing protein [Anaeromyxobacteraceae bacterium]
MGKSKLLTLAAVTALAAACTGSQGPAGSTGPTGPTGPGGSSTGIVSGTVTTTGTTSPASGVTVTALPGKATTTTAANGTYSLTLPIGVYTIAFTAPGVSGYTSGSISVTAGSTTTQNATLAYSPLVIATSVPYPAGFGTSPVVSASVTGGSGKYTYTWSSVSGPTALSLPSTTGSSVTVAMPQFSAVCGGLAPQYAGSTVQACTNAAFITPIVVPSRGGFLGVSAQQTNDMTYVLQVTATDGTYTQLALVDVRPMTVTQPPTWVGATPNFQTINMAVGDTVVLNAATTTVAYNWTLTVPGTSKAALANATNRNATFTPDVAGSYTATESVTAASLTIVANTYGGVTAVCSGCHGASGPGPAVIPEWSASAHANYFWNQPTQPAQSLFTFGLDGNFGQEYKNSDCVYCHTTGYQTPFAPNAVPPLMGGGGFSDTANGLSWVMPNPNAPPILNPATTSSNWAQLNPALQNFGSIQCEDCHGPVASFSKHTPMVSFSASMCGRCHDERPFHRKFEQWSTAVPGHANLQVAITEGTVQNNPASWGTSLSNGTQAAGLASCGRCHAGEGYVYWLYQQQGGCTNQAALTAAGNPPEGLLMVQNSDGSCTAVTSSATATSLNTALSNYGLNVNGVQPQTCQVCHDPHTTTLRVFDNTGPLPAGYSVTQAGAGAVCMTCHNTRNGARGDYLTPPLQSPSGTTLGAVPAVGAPHEANQADVYTGNNAYFLGAGPFPSPHMAVGDTCVGCHVQLYRPNPNIPGDGETTNHTFKFPTLSDGVTPDCTFCHASGVDGAGLIGAYTQGMGNVVTAANAAFQKAIAGLPNVVIRGSKQNVNIVGSGPTLTTLAGRSGITLSFATPINNPNATSGTVSTFTVSLANLCSDASPPPTTSFCTQVFSLSGTMAKANWNFNLIGDGGGGVFPGNAIHNPPFVTNVINSTVDALNQAGSSSYPY